MAPQSWIRSPVPDWVLESVPSGCWGRCRIRCRSLALLALLPFHAAFLPSPSDCNAIRTDTSRSCQNAEKTTVPGSATPQGPGDLRVARDPTKSTPKNTYYFSLSFECYWCGFGGVPGDPEVARSLGSCAPRDRCLAAFWL